MFWGVRHSGVIPLNDEIHIGIPNEQYKQSNEVVKAQLSEGYTWINEADNCPIFYGIILKDIYACIDFFDW